MPTKRFPIWRKRMLRMRWASLCSKPENWLRLCRFCKKPWRKMRMIPTCCITTAGLPACSPNKFLTSPQTAGLHLDFGELYARAQQWDKAAEQFQLETEVQPGSAEAFYRLGEALVQLGKFRDARTALVSSDQLKADMPETLYMLGKAAALDGDDSLAQKSWLHVLNLEKDTALAAQTHFGLAGIYRKQGKTPDANREMEEFRKLQGNAGHTDDSPK